MFESMTAPSAPLPESMRKQDASLLLTPKRSPSPGALQSGYDPDRSPGRTVLVTLQDLVAVALRQITGEAFGYDVQRWRRWLAESRREP